MLTSLGTTSSPSSLLTLEVLSSLFPFPPNFHLTLSHLSTVLILVSAPAGYHLFQIEFSKERQLQSLGRFPNYHLLIPKLRLFLVNNWVWRGQSDPAQPYANDAIVPSPHPPAKKKAWNELNNFKLQMFYFIFFLLKMSKFGKTDLIAFSDITLLMPISKLLVSGYYLNYFVCIIPSTRHIPPNIVWINGKWMITDWCPRHCFQIKSSYPEDEMHFL